MLTYLRALTILATVPALAAAGVINAHNATAFDARYDRFTSGFPTAPVVNTSPSFIGAGTNLSGVGWWSGDPRFHVTMISPRHYIAAAHVNYGANAQFNFYDAPNNAVRTVTTQFTRRMTTTFVNPNTSMVQTLPSDVILGTLTEPIPASFNITSYPIATGTNPQFIGLPLTAHGSNANYGAGNMTHVGTNNVSAIGAVSFDNFMTEANIGYTYAYNPSVGTPNEIYLIDGDSGGPSFFRYGAEYALMGGHYAVSNATLNPNPGDVSIDTFLPFYAGQIAGFMLQDTDAANPGGYVLQTVTVPEPGSLTLLAVAGGAWVIRRRRP